MDRTLAVQPDEVSYLRPNIVVGPLDDIAERFDLRFGFAGIAGM
jgi:hypothetical protein